MNRPPVAVDEPKHGNKPNRRGDGPNEAKRPGSRPPNRRGDGPNVPRRDKFESKFANKSGHKSDNKFSSKPENKSGHKSDDKAASKFDSGPRPARHGKFDNSNRGPRHSNRGGRDRYFDDQEQEEIRLPERDLRQAKDRTREKLGEWVVMQDFVAAQRSRVLMGEVSAKSNPIDTLDPWQLEAYLALEKGSSVIVDAPTTAGKTRVVEAFFSRNVDSLGFRAVYTTPVKSLSNDKLREFRQMFGREKVGIATGDIKENLDAPIVVATLESYRNSLLGVEPDLGRKIVIFDEYHFLQDQSRGSAWEEAIILTPKDCQILLLSASVANVGEFRGWLEQLLGRSVEMIRTEHRPVPLVNMVYTNNNWLLADETPKQIFTKPNRYLMEMPLKPDDLVPRLIPLLDLHLTPCIVYCGRRMACENLAYKIMEALQPLPPEHSEAIGAALQEAHSEVRSLSFLTMQQRRMMQTYGVGFHHSGLAPPARIAVEKLVKNGLLRFCVATMGLSVGINFAVRSALIGDYTRPGDTGFTAYSPSEVLQMLGRAGRRGRDPVGFSLWSTPEAYLKLGRAKRESCDSRLRNDPTTFLGLVGRGFNTKAIESFYGKSFRRFRSSDADLSLVRRDDVLEELAVSSIPCSSPTADTARFWNGDSDTSCYGCVHREPCHDYMEQRVQSDLAHMHLHLHALNALGRNELLTEFGTLARHFPQAGGMVIAHFIDKGVINIETLLRGAQLMASFALARFKEPAVPESYRFPFDAAEIEDKLTDFYPIELFPEVYEQKNRGGNRGKRGRGKPSGHKSAPGDVEGGDIIRDFNPAAGYIIKEWVQGMPWNDLLKGVTTEYFGTGDLMATIYRVATYLQSVAQATSGPLSKAARDMREVVLREPLSFSMML